MELSDLVSDIADALVAVDASGLPFKSFRPGVGPYGEPQLMRLVAEKLNQNDRYRGRVKTKRPPDLLIEGAWALECKIARPFGDNGRQAEDWSVNLLHPYPGNVSAVGDCLKLLELNSGVRKATVVIGFEHSPPQISLRPLIAAFEVVAERVARVDLGPRIEATRSGLCHPIHQQLTVYAWEVRGSAV
jgi:hypothetical protein